MQQRTGVGTERREPAGHLQHDRADHLTEQQGHERLHLGDRHAAAIAERQRDAHQHLVERVVERRV